MLRTVCIVMAVALCACGGDEGSADEGRYVLEGDALDTQGLVLQTGDVVSVQNTNDLDEAGLGGSDIYLHVGNTRLLVGSAPPGSDGQLAFCLQGEDHASIDAISTETMYCKWQAANLGAVGGRRRHGAGRSDDGDLRGRTRRRRRLKGDSLFLPARPFGSVATHAQAHQGGDLGGGSGGVSLRHRGRVAALVRRRPARLRRS
ncbi:MAG TPA: hypothetical protein ENK57_07500 [Polyangiaceae bacterium]|nr:hypothetical protein [Polyangiaceae bacterium]